MTKRILGLDLGTTSIGFAYVIENSENPALSTIERIGVRVNPLTTDEQTNFEKGKPITTNADRTLKRGARRNLQRFKLRRKNLIEALRAANFITDESQLTESGENSTHETWRLRAKAVHEKLEKDEFARVLLSINKKRGYKSSRKAKNDDEGQIIDGMAVAKQLYENGLTPGQYSYRILKNGKEALPDYYRSDLENELEQVWNFQKQHHPEILTETFRKEITGIGQRAVASIFWKQFKFNTAENKGTRDEKKIQAYKWRSDAVSIPLEKEEMAYVMAEICNDLNKSSGYLGSISDRSKELYFKKQTVGQKLYEMLQENPHSKLKNQVFYRQDYLDEFEIIWSTQQKFHSELTAELKAEIRDIAIFYQRKLKSQKGLISICELENKELVVESNGVKNTKTIGPRVIAKSNPLFQEFKIWQVLNNLEFKNKRSKEKLKLDLESKEILFEELNLKGNQHYSVLLSLLGYEPKEWEANYRTIEGNRTQRSLYDTYLNIIQQGGYDVRKLFGIDSKKDEINLDDCAVSAIEIKKIVKEIFTSMSIADTILDFDSGLDGKSFEKQASYQLWHLLYSYEGDDSLSGNDKLYRLLNTKFGFSLEQSKILGAVTFVQDYGDLSAKAIRKIYPFIKENNYSDACVLAEYRHSKMSLTADEIANRKLKPRLDILKKNSLRNPVVEKILNQMVNVVNTMIETENDALKKKGLKEDFAFDEIRIELARELKKNASERAEMTSQIGKAQKRHQEITILLQREFGVKNPSRNDIIRFKLYQELKNNGYKDLYTNKYIAREILFSKEIDIDHIIPQAKLFDDSFSNKTIVFRKDNLEKGNQTAFDYIRSKFSERELHEYELRVKNLFDHGKKSIDEGISKAKSLKLLKTESEIGDGFIERDLRDSQYIAKKAKNMLFEISRSVLTTTGSVTDRLREDWGLINIMQELNFSKYKNLGLTELVEKKDGSFKERIVDWTKRNDHRHHAMDALAVAFTRISHIQYLNYLNARRNESHKLHGNIIAIENKETIIQEDDRGNKKRIFREPILNFRTLAKDHLSGVLISHKAKNKVVTLNKNKLKTKNGESIKIEKTPRGQLHKESIYGRIKIPVVSEEKISAKFDADTIERVTIKKFRLALLARLSENNNDPKLAFTGKNALAKKPIYLDVDCKTALPEKVKLVMYMEDYTIRKPITPELKIEKVIDAGIRSILEKRLHDFGGDPKKAFVDLDKNPIWLNEKAGVSVKRVTISGVTNAEPLHFKKNHFGRHVLDSNGARIPVDFTQTGNNHHVAIYKDDQGNLQEKVVSFYEAVARVNQGIPIIDKMFNHHIGWVFQFTMKQNEYFVFPNEVTGFYPDDIDLLDSKNKRLISPNLFRVQKISTKNYVFNNHLETVSVDGEILKTKKILSGIMYHFLQTPTKLEGVVKVRINHLGDIVGIGEY